MFFCSPHDTITKTLKDNCVHYFHFSDLLLVHLENKRYLTHADVFLTCLWLYYKNEKENTINFKLDLCSDTFGTDEANLQQQDTSHNKYAIEKHSLCSDEAHLTHNHSCGFRASWLDSNARQPSATFPALLCLTTGIVPMPFIRVEIFAIYSTSMHHTLIMRPSHFVFVAHISPTLSP